MISKEIAREIVREWIRAWNAHDLDAIMTHYAEGVKFTSPFVIKLLGEASGKIEGKDQLRAYFAKGLAARPDLKFELIDLLIGVNTLTIYYRSVTGTPAAEVMVVNDEGQITKSWVHYREIQSAADLSQVKPPLPPPLSRPDFSFEQSPKHAIIEVCRAIGKSSIQSRHIIHERGYRMPVKKLKEFLDQQNIKYVSIIHSPAYTSQEVAASAHIPGKNLAKTVMVMIDGQMAMVVLPASFKVDFEQLKEITGVSNARLADEQEFRDKFPECEVGAMPPFGNLYGMQVFVSDALTEDEEIAFNAGSHTELIKMAYSDFERLVKPRVVKISEKMHV